MPSSFIIFANTVLAFKFLHNYSLYLITSHGVMKKSCANVVEAPISIVDPTLRLSFLNSKCFFIYSYIKNWPA